MGSFPSIDSDGRCNILSPITGELREDTRGYRGDADFAVGIYVFPEDEHWLYAPVSGKVKWVLAENGAFEVPGRTFLAKQHEEGRLRIGIVPDCLLNTVVEILVYVGDPFWVTDRVDLPLKRGEKVEGGKRIGEIVVDSWVDLTITGDGWKRLETGVTRLVGGKSVLFVAERSVY